MARNFRTADVIDLPIITKGPMPRLSGFSELLLAMALFQLFQSTLTGPMGSRNPRRTLGVFRTHNDKACGVFPSEKAHEIHMLKLGSSQPIFVPARLVFAIGTV